MAEKIPVRDSRGNKIGHVREWSFDITSQSFYISAVLDDGSNFEGSVPVTQVDALIPLKEE